MILAIRRISPAYAAPKCFIAISFAAGLFALSAQAQMVTFGNGANQFDMEFVEIGSPGNPGDTPANQSTGPDIPLNPPNVGAVDYVYSMAKFAVSRDMVEKANLEGNLGITMSDMTNFGGNGSDRPATGISWNEAARFINWLNQSEGYAHAYKFDQQPGDLGYNSNSHIELWTNLDSGFDPDNPFRNTEAAFFLPSVDEWYKAAYFDPVDEAYYLYPGSDTIPTAVLAGTDPDTAVFGHASSQGPADITEAGGLTPFGLMGMAGNAQEWEENVRNLTRENFVATLARAHRGGRWHFGPDQFEAGKRNQTAPQSGGNAQGFRVATSLTFDVSTPTPVPEPRSLILWGIAGVFGLWTGRRWLWKRPLAR